MQRLAELQTNHAGAGHGHAVGKGGQLPGEPGLRWAARAMSRAHLAAALPARAAARPGVPAPMIAARVRRVSSLIGLDIKALSLGGGANARGRAPRTLWSRPPGGG